MIKKRWMPNAAKKIILEGNCWQCQQTDLEGAVDRSLQVVRDTLHDLL